MSHMRVYSVQVLALIHWPAIRQGDAGPSPQPEWKRSRQQGSACTGQEQTQLFPHTSRFFLSKVVRNQPELFKRGFEIVDDLLCDDVGIGKIGGIF